MSTAPCMNCTHPGRSDHYDGPCTAPECTCKRYIAPISAARYQALLDWAHTGKDMTNIKGDDLPAILLSYEQVLDGVFALVKDIERIPTYTRDGRLRHIEAYREDVVATVDTRLRKTFGMED